MSVLRSPGERDGVPIPHRVEPDIDGYLGEEGRAHAKESRAQHGDETDRQHLPVGDGVAPEAEDDAQAGTPSST